MLKTNHKNPSRKHAVMIAILIGEIALLALIAFSLTREYVRTRSVREARRGLESEVGALIKELEELSALIQEFASPQFQEKIARTKLGLAKPDEKVYVIRGDLPEGSQEKLALNNVNPPPATQWWQYFFGQR